MKKKLHIKEILKLIPKENNEKQKDMKNIYQNLFLKEEELNEKKINLDPSFWDKTNEIVLEDIKTFFEENKSLKDINVNEEKAIEILEIIYKYIQPQIYGELKIVPNQNGTFSSYNDLNNEKDLNGKFKEMLKSYFQYDISEFLIHKKLKLTTPKLLTINEDIIKTIKNSFSDQFGNKEDIQKAKILIKFYPKNENENEDNIVKQFIQCYKIISGEEINEEEINTMNISLWEKPIKILLIELLKTIDNDRSINNTSKRTGLNEEDIITNLNIFYKIFFIYIRENKIYENYSFVPNEKGNYIELANIYYNLDIDNEIRDILTILDEKNSFDDSLINQKIILSIKHQQKTLEDIAIVIDKDIKRKFIKIDSMIESQQKDIKIEDNVKNACKKLIYE